MFKAQCPFHLYPRSTIKKNAVPHKTQDFLPPHSRVNYNHAKNILIDEKVNDEGGHGYRVVERLVKLGFSKKELMVLKFAESDIDRAMQEGEENV